MKSFMSNSFLWDFVICFYYTLLNRKKNQQLTNKIHERIFKRFKNQRQNINISFKIVNKYKYLFHTT